MKGRSMAKTTPLVFVLYDGIEHSVFEGQVLDPLLKKLSRDKTLTATLVSFETEHPPKKSIKKLNSLHPRLTITIFKKTFFLGWISLAIGSWQLQSILSQLKYYTVIARGPLAGLIAKKTVTHHCSQLILQARGLLAEEHRFICKNKSFFTQWIYKIRTYQLAYWEKKRTRTNCLYCLLSKQSVKHLKTI